jgi:predicted ArsR family transcriptional regulator
MFLKTLRDIARPQVVAIFDAIKRSGGLSVAEIARELKMSYMGIKQHCLDLEKKGYLDTWRRPKEVGRPELAYRLTSKAQALYPQWTNELSIELLESVRQLYGATAAEKILFTYLTRKGEAYAKKIKGPSVIEKATALARLRDAEGYCAQVDYDPQLGFRLTEFHNPLREVMELYPSVARMEETMMTRLLQAKVTRSEEVVSGLTRYTFHIATMEAPTACARTAPEPDFTVASETEPEPARSEPAGSEPAGPELLDEEPDGPAVPPRQTTPSRLTTPVTGEQYAEETLLAMP